MRRLLAWGLGCCAIVGAAAFDTAAESPAPDGLKSVAEVAQPSSAFTIRADWFDRGNVRVSRPGEGYADKYACIWNAGAGTQPVRI